MAAGRVEQSDRRHRRRRETIEQALDIALEVMAEQGVAGLSLGEVARRMGIRPPSLYVYFDSKSAIYEEIFARGWCALADVMEPVLRELAAPTDVQEQLLAIADALVRWAMAHQAYSQLMFWRPVPGWAPSPETYEPAVVLLRHLRAVFATLRERGQLRADVALEELVAAWTVVTSGVISQQLANAPAAAFEDGPFTTLLPQVVEMYLGMYGGQATAARTGHGKAPDQTRIERRS